MWVEKNFLKIGFRNVGVELQVILQSSLALERGKYGRKWERYHNKLYLKLCEKRQYVQLKLDYLYEHEGFYLVILWPVFPGCNAS